MANILMGVMAGELLISTRSVQQKFKLLVMAGLGCLAFGLVMDGTLWPGVDWEWGFAPAVKRIWTPTFAVFSAGWTLLFQAAFLWVIDLKGFRKWSIVFTIVGMNPLTIYIMHTITEGWIRKTLNIHFGAYLFDGSGGSILHQALTVLCLWGILFWMYRRKIFIRI
jgi:predicted acyltransferase